MSALKQAFRHVCRRLVRGAGIFAAVSVSACASEPRPGTLAAYAHEAKRAGRTSTAFVEAPELTEGDLDDLVRPYSVVVASPVNLRAATTSTETAIFTWSIFRVEEVITRRDVSSYLRCNLTRPQQVKLGSHEVAIPRVGGTVTVDGVSVTQRGGWESRTLDPTRRYVFLAVMCPDAVMGLPLDGEELFEVSSTGRITSVYGARADWQRQMEALGTLSALIAYLKKAG